MGKRTMALDIERWLTLVPEEMPDMPQAGLDWVEAGRTSQVLARARDRHALIELALDAVSTVCGADAAALWVYQPNGMALTLAGERGLQDNAGRPQWSDLLKVPLNSGGLLLGVLEGYSRHADGFDEPRRAAFQMLAATVATSLHRCRVQEQAAVARPQPVDADRLAELEMLWKLTQATSHALNYPRLFESLLGVLRQVLPHDGAVLLDTTGPHPECRLALDHLGHAALAPELVQRARAAYASFGGGEVQVHPESVYLVADTSDGAGAAPLVDSVAVPLTQQGELVGVLYVAACRAGAFDDRQRRVMQQFATHASSTLEHIRNLLAGEAERLDTIIGSLPQGVVLLDAEGAPLLCNRNGSAQLRLLGAAGPRVEVLGDLPLAELVAEAGESGNDLTTREIELRLSDRTWHFSITVVPVYDQGELVGTVLSIQDITEIRQTEQRLFHDARLASIGEFASGLAHELNNPMMIVLGIAEVLGEDQTIPPAKRQLLDDMEQAVLRAAGIVKQLMVFADTQRDSSWDTLHLPTILPQAIDLVSSQCRGDGVEVELDWGPRLPTVQGNAGKLQQLVLSVLRNASEAIGQSGQGSKITVRCRAVDDKVVLEVEDDGPGVPPELRTRIFDVFFTTKRDYQGKGLGLSVAYGIAVEHGGTLTCEESPAGGALFRLELPARRF